MSVSKLLKIAYNYDWTNKTILECGSGRYGEESIEFDQTNCWYVEPDPEYFNYLKNVQKKINILNVAISDIDGKINFTTTTHYGNGSINHSIEHMEELNSYKSSFSVVEVPSMRYDTFIKNVITKKIDILILDVEGAETTILKTFFDINENKLPDIITIEVGYDWNDRLNLLKQLNYDLDFYYFNNGYLTKTKSNIIKNVIEIKKFNNEWRTWSWNGRIIYKNDL